MARISIAHHLAVVFLRARWDRDSGLQDSELQDSVLQTAQRYFRQPQPWLKPLVDRVMEQFPEFPPLDRLVRFIAMDVDFRLAVKTHNIKSLSLPTRRTLGRKVKVVHSWELPTIENGRQLAEWLDISQGELFWLANLVTRRPPGSSRSDHYVYTWIRKRSGGLRLVESPKVRLKEVQRRILNDLIGEIPTHHAAHGFCRGRSVVSFVEPHVGSPFCLKMDLKDFFPSIRFGRVVGLFRAAGYGAEVSRLLAALCTNAVDPGLLDGADAGSIQEKKSVSRLYGYRHLPQGAPTSPCLANLTAFSMDARLIGLARSANVTYTRYADDLLFSGGREWARSVRRFETTVGAIVMEEGYDVQFRKTRMMPSSQRQTATGVVINQRTNISRVEFDRLKAILFNCCRFGPGSQNRDGDPNFRLHLQGRIEWVRQLNESRAGKLQRLFERIDWTG